MLPLSKVQFCKKIINKINKVLKKKIPMSTLSDDIETSFFSNCDTRRLESKIILAAKRIIKNVIIYYTL